MIEPRRSSPFGPARKVGCRLALHGAALVLPALLVLTLPGGPSASTTEKIAAAPEETTCLGIGGGSGDAGGLPLTSAEIADTMSVGLTLRSVAWAAGALLDWTPFGPPLQSAWNIHPLQETSEPLITDDQFVWGPNVGDFDIATFLNRRGSPLAAYADEIALWAGYSSVNPQVLLAVLELRYGTVDHFADGADRATVESQIETTALDLATAFYEHLYTWGARAEDGVADRLPPSLVLADGMIVAIESATTTSGTYALQRVLSEGSDLATFQALTARADAGGFSATFAELFPGVDLLAEDNPINPTDAPADLLFQLPFPLGATWYFNGPHSWNGDNTPPFSSMDFFQGGADCDSPPALYAVATAAGSAIRRYSCWMEIDHGGGWTTSYYHLRNLVGSGTQIRNGRLGSIACEVCAGGYATGPHVHWSLKYNGAYVSLEGVKLSGWTVHVGPTAYFTGGLERAGVQLPPYSLILNDYHTYYPTYNTSLRFFGNGIGDIDRLKIAVDNPLNTYSGPPADVGWTDFTIEWWMKALPGDNTAPAVTCGANTDRIYGNTLLDRDRFGQDRDFGVSLADGRIVFGVSGQGSGDLTSCTTTRVDDGQWHHIAIVRNRWDGTANPVKDGELWVFIDGRLEAHALGPTGDISYPDDGVPLNLCGTGGTSTCTNDPYLVFGAEKHDLNPALYPSYRGWIDEVRISDNLRYTADFSRPTAVFAVDANTIAMLRFDENAETVAYDTSGADAGPSNGLVRIGGSPVGPGWSTDVPFPADTGSPRNIIFIPLVMR